MDPFVWLLSLCVAMFFGAYLAGLVPLTVAMNASRLRLITIFGAGLLVGTALIVIIPEGVAMHYESQLSHTGKAPLGGHHAHGAAPSPDDVFGGGLEVAGHPSLRRLLSVVEPLEVAAVPVAARSLRSASKSRSKMVAASDAEADSAAAVTPILAVEGSGAGGSAGEDAHSGHDHGGAAQHEGEEEDEHQHPGHWQIGAALALGFAFQLIVDRLSGGLHSHSPGTAVSHSGSSSAVALNGGGSAGGGASATSTAVAGSGAVIITSLDASEGPACSPAGSEHAENAAFHPRENVGGDHSAKSKSALAGLIVHAMVDGVALGAAVKEGDGALGMIVFVAIMLHKAPSSFGLASYLLHHGISRDGVQKRLLMFSCAAPFGAIATYLLLSANLFSYKQESVALCLLFSGGTFLYVATAHVLPEVQSGAFGPRVDDDDDDAHHHGGHSHRQHSSHPKMPWREVWTLIAGVLLPLFMNMNHGH